ncbi:molybdopterin molybdenumtransferase MoeA [Rhodovibrio sodomensis]|uniref:Molybdopterin molybdenumtransferase n=1 Tax=Rhodovibrio sodomensis TaxID=1088 RepID=A0ABS1DFW7_9PROT|nr:gephyrin-like molybdotransferase Glp [Rhodovibrio sodomensis]MBK1669134.1 molybdopterin molybdenumtransferase MoeA [Rhodovibrio sodomensis]
MLTVEDARAQILAAFEPLPAEVVSVDRAFGRVLAQDVTARVTQPPRDVSAMDGYAVRAADLARAPVTLQIVGEIPAGGDFDRRLPPGAAVRIFTGAPLPDGADTIVIQENAARDGDRVTVEQAEPAGRWVRPAGLDFQAGSVGLAAGRRLSARDVGLAAAMNRPWLSVRRKPRVAVLSTGNEVVLPGEELGPSQIVSSNGYGLSAFVEACGGAPLHLGVAPDTKAGLREVLEGALHADLLLTSGGVSVGEHDLVQAVLRDLGADLGFWKIAMRPGKPLMLADLRGTAVLGLPGNPVSGMVCSTLFVRPAIDRMLGRDAPAEPRLPALAGRDLGDNGPRQDYMRCTLTLDGDGNRIATPFDRQDSSMLSRLAQADGLLVRAPHAPALPAGGAVEVVPFDAGV